MRETEFSHRLTDKIKTWGEYERIENSMGQGTWDIFCIVDKRANWIETKVAHNGEIYFEKFQPNFARKFLRAGLTNMFVVVRITTKEFRVFHAQKIIDAPKEIKGKWQVVRLQDLGVPELIHSSPTQWPDLRLLLSTLFT